MKLQWMQQGQPVDSPAIGFGFDSVEQLVEGQVTISWFSDGGKPIRMHNLIISDTGVDKETLGKAVIEAARNHPLVKHQKGDINQGTARDVYPIFNDPALPFRAGLTVHSARGTWSSLPHKFEAEEILTPRPMPFYEQFAYVTDPPGGWGIQMRIGHLYYQLAEDEDLPQAEEDYNVRFVNSPVVIRDRDILDIPLGSHPVTGGPGYKICYVWCYWSNPAQPWVMGLREKF